MITRQVGMEAAAVDAQTTVKLPREKETPDSQWSSPGKLVAPCCCPFPIAARRNFDETTKGRKAGRRSNE